MSPRYRRAFLGALALALGLIVSPRGLNAQTRPVNDAQILSLLDRVTKVEVECSSYTFDHAALAETRSLAEKLRNDHGAFRVEGQLLAEKLGLALDPNITSAVADSHYAVLADLHVTTGTNLDRIFIDHEVVLLQFALNYIVRFMVPVATAPEIKDLLRRAEPLLKSHLELARAAKRHLPKET
jgi:predicted outer membrane protein